MIKLTQRQDYEFREDDFVGKIEEWRVNGGWAINVALVGNKANGAFYGVETEDDVDRIASVAKMALRAIDSKKPTE